MNKNVYVLKEEIRTLATKQTDLKAQRKQEYHGKRAYTQGQAADAVRSAKYELRHMHIAYALLRGREYEQVEQSVRSKDGFSNTPSMSYVEKIKEEYGHEVVRASA